VLPDLTRASPVSDGGKNSLAQENEECFYVEKMASRYGQAGTSAMSGRCRKRNVKFCELQAGKGFQARFVKRKIAGDPFSQPGYFNSALSGRANRAGPGAKEK
jgi:hypothetical protein